MTPTTLAAAILRDVRRCDPNWNREMMDDANDGDWVTYGEVLAALTAALDPALSERAGEVLEGVTPGPWTHEWEIDGPETHTRIKAGAAVATTAQQCGRPHHRAASEANARFIAWCREGVPALLAQNAALRAERDELAAAIDSIETSHGLTSNGNLWRFWSKKAREYIDSCDRDRKAAEAQIAALTARVEGLTGALDRLEAYGFTCDAGPLSLCAEWIAIKEELSCRP